MDVKPVNIPLLPYRFKLVGLLLASMGCALGIMCFYFGIKPEFLDVHVFAIYSKYFQSSYFSIIENNIIEELSGLLLIGGLALITLSKEKTEKDIFNFLRLKALILSIYINTGFLIFSTIFIYGIGFIVIMILNLFSELFIFNLLFYYSLFRLKEKEKNKTEFSGEEFSN